MWMERVRSPAPEPSWQRDPGGGGGAAVAAEGAGGRYLADDLLRVYSSEVSAWRVGFNDVAPGMLPNAKPQNTGPVLTPAFKNDKTQSPNGFQKNMSPEQKGKGNEAFCQSQR